MIEATCPNCQATVRLPVALAGRESYCDSCNTFFNVPLRSGGAATLAVEADAPAAKVALSKFDFAFARDSWSIFGVLKHAHRCFINNWRVLQIGAILVAILSLLFTALWSIIYGQFTTLVAMDKALPRFASLPDLSEHAWRYLAYIALPRLIYSSFLVMIQLCLVRLCLDALLEGRSQLANLLSPFRRFGAIFLQTLLMSLAIMLCVVLFMLAIVSLSKASDSARDWLFQYRNWILPMFSLVLCLLLLRWLLFMSVELVFNTRAGAIEAIFYSYEISREQFLRICFLLLMLGIVSGICGLFALAAIYIFKLWVTAGGQAFVKQLSMVVGVAASPYLAMIFTTLFLSLRNGAEV